MRLSNEIRNTFTFIDIFDRLGEALNLEFTLDFLEAYINFLHVVRRRVMNVISVICEYKLVLE